MQRPFLVVLLGAILAAPLAAAAQTPPDRMGPPPEMRAKMQTIHAQAKTDAYSALSADHRSRVQAIVTQVTSGTMRPREGSQQIDALLTPDESKAVLGVARTTRDAMRTAFASMRGGSPPDAGATPAAGTPVTPPNAAGPNAPPPNGAPGAAAPNGAAPGGGYGRRMPSAGRFLLMVSMTPEQMRALRAPRPSPTP